MLCHSCEEIRFPPTAAAVTIKTPSGVNDIHAAATARTIHDSAAAAAFAQNENSTQTQQKTSYVSTAGCHINELLTYAQFYRDRSTMEMLHKTIISYYHPTEITEAKRTLVDIFSTQLNDCPFAVSRRQSATRLTHEVEAEDIIRIFETLDDRQQMGSTRFVAATLDRLPKNEPHEDNLYSVAEKQARTDNDLAALSNRVKELTNDLLRSTKTANDNLVKMDEQLTRLGEKTQSQMDSFATTSMKLDDFIRSFSQAEQHGGTENPTLDRSRNVIITGVTECRNPTEWRDVASHALNTAAGNNVQIADAFRLGRFVEGRKRPILVKLHTVWDRRLVVNGARKLREIADLSHVYISADEPTEVRRKNTLARLKTKAEREHKTVAVSSDGVLLVDGAEIFSLQRGFIRSRRQSEPHTS